MVAELPTETELLQFACTNCFAQLCIPQAMAGVTGPCPHCNHTITAPWPKRNRAPKQETVFPTYTEHVPAPTPTREPAPLARDQAPAAHSEVPAIAENVSPLSEEREEPRVCGIALFEKRSFRPLRTTLAVAACVTIFLSFEALKSRRWVWQAAKSDTLASEISPSAPASPVLPVAPSKPRTPMVTPPSLPNLGTLSAENR